MEIDITRFFYNAEPFNFSGSRLERGNNAAQETWDNALEEAERSPLLTTNDQLTALRDHMRGFGAWDDMEITDWTKVQCNAMFIQLVSGDMRESGLDTDEINWGKYEKAADEGRVPGNIYRGDNDRIYYYLGV